MRCLGLFKKDSNCNRTNMTTKKLKGAICETMQYIGIIALSCLSGLWLVIRQQEEVGVNCVCLVL